MFPKHKDVSQTVVHHLLQQREPKNNLDFGPAFRNISFLYDLFPTQITSVIFLVSEAKTSHFRALFYTLKTWSFSRNKSWDFFSPRFGTFCILAFLRTFSHLYFHNV